jgi:hypothetical protein
VDANFGALSGFGDYTENSYRKGWTAGGSASALMTGAGYWFDKDGNARIGNPATDKYIKFDVSTGIVNLGSAVALQWSAVTGSGKPADNATVGATWGSNLNNIPGYLGTTIIDLSSVASGRLVAYAGGTNQVGITAEGSGESAVRIYAGSAYADRASAPFRVTQGGSVHVSDLIASGSFSSINGEASVVMDSNGIKWAFSSESSIEVNLNYQKIIFHWSDGTSFLSPTSWETADDDLAILAASYVDIYPALKINSLEVSYGVNDSGGAGYRLLRIPNA